MQTKDLIALTVFAGGVRGRSTADNPVYPESQTKFFLKVVDAEAEFVTDEKGQVNAVIPHQGGQDHKGVRK